MNEPATNSLPTTPRQASATLAYVALGLALFAPLLVLLNVPTYQLPQPFSSAITWLTILSVPAAFTVSIVSLSMGKGKGRKGRGFAIAALVISIVTIAFFVLAIIVAVTVLSGAITGGLGLLALILGAH